MLFHKLMDRGWKKDCVEDGKVWVEMLKLDKMLMILWQNSLHFFTDALYEELREGFKLLI